MDNEWFSKIPVRKILEEERIRLDDQGIAWDESGSKQLEYVRFRRENGTSIILKRHNATLFRGSKPKEIVPIKGKGGKDLETYEVLSMDSKDEFQKGRIIVTEGIDMNLAKNNPDYARFIADKLLSEERMDKYSKSQNVNDLKSRIYIGTAVLEVSNTEGKKIAYSKGRMPENEELVAKYNVQENIKANDEKELELEKLAGKIKKSLRPGGRVARRFEENPEELRKIAEKKYKEKYEKNSKDVEL